MAKLRLGGADGLVGYLADRLCERGHTIGEPADAYLRVVEPACEPYEVHVAEVVVAAGRLSRGAVAISIVTRHTSKLIARYKRAEKVAKVDHGVVGVRAVGIVTGEVRDPAITGMNAVDPALHARLFPGTLDPEAVVFAAELGLRQDDRVLHAAPLERWLRAGAGAIREPFRQLPRDPRRARAALVAMGFACEALPGLGAAQLIGAELALRIRADDRPVDYEADVRDDDPDMGVGSWANSINAALDRHAHQLGESRRVWHLDREHVAFTSASEWAVASR